jgi:hypothetical protein
LVSIFFFGFSIADNAGVLFENDRCPACICDFKNIPELPPPKERMEGRAMEEREGKG